MTEDNQCDLCELKPITKCYFENDTWKIVDCSSCNSPIAVYKKHNLLIPNDELIFILNRIEELFGKVLIRTKQRKIKDHFHFHILNNNNI